MTKETRVSADRQLREDHLRRTITWKNCKLDSVELSIMNAIRSEEPDLEMITCLIGERENIKHECKDLHKKLYG